MDAEKMGMSQTRNHQLAYEAMEAAEIAVDVYCKANGFDPFDIAPEIFETFLDVATGALNLGLAMINRAEQLINEWRANGNG